MSIPLVTVLPSFQDNGWLRFITKEKERALYIYAQVTISWRRPNSTPDSDGFELIYKVTKLTKGTYLTSVHTKI